MKELDAVIDHKPTITIVRELAELRIRNLDCFRELQSLNDTGNFLFKHPLIKNYSQRAELEALLKRDPTAFMLGFAKVKDNVARYSSFIKSNKKTPEQKENARKLLAKHKATEALYISVVEKK